MTTSAQIRANRQNARRSTGPRTPLGRKASSKNAIRHGLTSEPPADAILAHLCAILDDPWSTLDRALRTPHGIAALTLAIAEARLDHARAHTATIALYQPRQTMRAEIKQARGALREAKEKDDFDAQISGQMLLLSLTDAADRDDERTLRSARRHLAEAHAARRKALLTYVRLLS